MILCKVLSGEGRALILLPILTVDLRYLAKGLTGDRHQLVRHETLTPGVPNIYMLLHYLTLYIRFLDILARLIHRLEYSYN